MAVEKLTVLFGMVFLALGAVVMAHRIQRGRKLCDEFARRLPDEYRANNQPRPAFFYSARSAAYSEFVLQRKFRRLSDPRLVAAFEEVRREEVKTLIFVFSGFAMLGAAFLWIEMSGRG